MAFLDFIRNRQQQPAEQSIQQPKPETAREMYARQGEQERATQPKVEQLRQAEREQAKDAGARIDRAAQYVRSDDTAPTPAPSSGSSSPQPMRQNMLAQNEVAPALSPTSAQRGQTAQEKTDDAPKQEERQPSQQRPQTIARATPSWER